MRITHIDIRDFRSIAHIRLDDLGPAVIFYGRNGAGKSNVIAAIRAAFQTLQRLVSNDLPTRSDAAMHIDDVIRQDDFRVQGSGTIGLGITLTAPAHAPILVLEELPLLTLTFRVVIERRGAQSALGWCSQLVGGLPEDPKALDLIALMRGEAVLPSSSPDIPPQERTAAIANTIRSFLSTNLWGRGFRVVGDVRQLDTKNIQARESGDVLDLLLSGDIKGAFAVAHQHESAAVRDRFARLRHLLSTEPLSLPMFEPVRRPKGVIDVQTRIPGGAVSIDLSGLGLLQLFYIVASIALSPAAAVALEEPEAHLHAPSSGRALRTLLVRMLDGDEPMLHQLFLATHSNLFDLDPTGYYHVALDAKGTTQIERRTDLVTIDRDHLWEPGPARHALEDVMQVLSAGTVVAHRPDGTPVTARQMLDHLQKDDDIAKSFCQDVIGAAVRAVRVRAKSR